MRTAVVARHGEIDSYNKPPRGMSSMNRLALLVFCAVACGIPHAHADEASSMAILRAGCTEDAQRFCAGVQAGGGRVLACLKQHKDALSANCKQAAQQAATASGGNSAPTPAN